MQEKLFPDNMPAKDKIDNLQAMAYSIEETDYYVDLSADELDAAREQLSEKVIKVRELEDEKKRTNESIKLRQKPLKVEITELIISIKTKRQQREGTLYHVDDQEAGMMHSYDHNGQLVQSRRLRPDERQGSIFSIQQAQ